MRWNKKCTSCRQKIKRWDLWVVVNWLQLLYRVLQRYCQYILLFGTEAGVNWIICGVNVSLPYSVWYISCGIVVGQEVSNSTQASGGSTLTYIIICTDYWYVISSTFNKPLHYRLHEIIMFVGCGCIPQRVLLVFFIVSGLVTCYLMRTSVNLALSEMTYRLPPKKGNNQTQHDCPPDPNSKNKTDSKVWTMLKALSFL